MSWLLLALVSAATLAAADVATKYFFRGRQGWELVVIRLAVPGVFLLPVVFAHPLPAVPPVFWAWMAVLVPLEIVGMLLYLVAIRDAPLYLTLPYVAFTPVFNVVGGYVLLGEQVTLKGFAGVLLVVLGAYLLNLDGHKLRAAGGWSAPLRAIAYERGSRLMLAAAAIYSVTSVGSKQAMSYATPESFGPFYFVLIGILVAAASLLYHPRRLRVLARGPGALAVIGALSAIMVVTHFLGIALVQVAYFIAVKRTSLLFGIALGAALLGERVTPRHVIAGSIMLGGVLLIAGG